MRKQFPGLSVGMNAKAKKFLRQLRLWARSDNTEGWGNSQGIKQCASGILLVIQKILIQKQELFSKVFWQSRQLFSCQPLSRDPNELFLVRPFCLNKELLVSVCHPTVSALTCAYVQYKLLVNANTCSGWSLGCFCQPISMWSLMCQWLNSRYVCTQVVRKKCFSVDKLIGITKEIAATTFGTQHSLGSCRWSKYFTLFSTIIASHNREQ